MNYKQTVKEFMNKYRTNVLGLDKEDAGFWRKKKYYHILSEQKKELNFLIKDFKIIENKLIVNNQEITLHIDWKHLLSSQVLCINYFYEFCNNKEKLDRLLEFFGINEKALNAEFEVIVKDKTNVDFTINLKSGKKVYIEIKYTELDFGNAKYTSVGSRLYEEQNDLKKGSIKIKEVDLKVKKEIYTFGKEKYKERYNEYYNKVDIYFEDYLKYYQIVRNIVLGENDYCIFILPEENISAMKHLNEGLDKIKNIDDFNFKIIKWEELLRFLPNNKVKEKYFPKLTE